MLLLETSQAGHCLELDNKLGYRCQPRTDRNQGADFLDPHILVLLGKDFFADCDDFVSSFFLRIFDYGEYVFDCGI